LSEIVLISDKFGSTRSFEHTAPHNCRFTNVPMVRSDSIHHPCSNSVMPWTSSVLNCATCKQRTINTQSSRYGKVQTMNNQPSVLKADSMFLGFLGLRCAGFTQARTVGSGSCWTGLPNPTSFNSFPLRRRLIRGETPQKTN
jgi:hypothetical protein